MPIIDYKINGETYYTHSTWLSNRQRRIVNSVPGENKELAVNYSFSTLALIGIASYRLPVLAGFFKRVGVYSGAGFLAAGTFLAWSILMKNTTRNELDTLIQDNDCSTTPFWKEEEKVVDLLKETRKENKDALKRYYRRIQGSNDAKQGLEKYHPDYILEANRSQELK